MEKNQEMEINDQPESECTDQPVTSSNVLESSVPIEDSQDNPEDSDLCTLTLNDVLQLQEDLIEDTAAVLGAANDKCCSYNDGYLKRQALYSCLTCIPEAKEDPTKRAGVCLACSYHCHDGHELIELYTKRNFRCDCGNNKFNGFKCNLAPNKSDINIMNSYNQNFSGVYCVCHRPYPDPEDPLPDEMIQCIMCEDWYHSRHLGSPLPTEAFAEMICESCIKKHEFLLHYDNLSMIGSHRQIVDEKAIVDVVTNDSPNVDKPSEVENVSSSNDKEETVEICTKQKLKSEKVAAKFFENINWRKQLCICTKCLQLYTEEGVMFLIDNDDPVHLYEEQGKAKAKEIVENQESNFMKSLNRVQLVDAIAGYNDLKENLANYLKKFAENKKVVREEDIKEFFDGMNARKKQKVEVPYYCR